MKTLNPLSLARSINSSEMREAVVDDFVTMMEPIAFFVACASDLILSWNRLKPQRVQADLV